MTEHRNHWHLAQLQGKIKSGALQPAAPVETPTATCPNCGQPYIESAIGRKAHAQRRQQCAWVMEGMSK